MITQSEYLRRLAQHTHFSLPDLMNRANRLREAEMLKQGGRGLSAAKIEALEGAWIILAAMSGVSANECPNAARQLSNDMPLMNVDGTKYEEVSINAINQDTVTVSAPETGRALDVISAITEILDDPLKADRVKSFVLDHINKRAILSWTDGREDVFGKTDDFNSGASVFLHGRVLRLLSIAIRKREKGSKAHFEWGRQVVKIGRELGEEAAEKWMTENPFQGEEE